MVSIYFHPDGYTSRGRQVMGRHIAGETFLKAYLKYSTTKSFALQLESPSHLEVFRSIRKEANSRIAVETITRSSFKKLSKYGVSFYPGPGLSEWAQMRSFYGHSRWSLCGITHTIASDRAMDAISDLITYPIQPWDALICTSSAVQQSVKSILDRKIDYLRCRFKASKFPVPQLPVIPLGVDQASFQFSKEERLQSRNEFGIQR